MNQFPSQLVLLPADNGHDFVIGQDFYFITKKGKVRKTPKGFICDLASIPKIFWNILDRWGWYGKACAAHDRSYWVQDITRAEADNDLWEGMQYLISQEPNTIKRAGMQIQATTIISFVKTFGGLAWSNNAKQDKSTGYCQVISIDGTITPIVTKP